MVEPSTSMLGVSIVSPSTTTPNVCGDCPWFITLTHVALPAGTSIAAGSIAKSDNITSTETAPAAAAARRRRRPGLPTVAAAGDGHEREHRRQCRGSHAEPTHHRSPSGRGVRANMRAGVCARRADGGARRPHPGGPVSLRRARPCRDTGSRVRSILRGASDGPRAGRGRAAARSAFSGCPGWPARPTSTATPCSPRWGSATTPGRSARGDRARGAGEDAEQTVVPIRWSAAGAAGLFPSLDADLEIAPLGPTGRSWR